MPVPGSRHLSPGPSYANSASALSLACHVKVWVLRLLHATPPLVPTQQQRPSSCDSTLCVPEPEDDLLALPGTIYSAPGTWHLAAAQKSSPSENRLGLAHARAALLASTATSSNSSPRPAASNVCQEQSDPTGLLRRCSTRLSKHHKSSPFPCVCCRPSTFLHWAARAFSFARSLFCPFSELALPLLLLSPLSILLQASRPPSPWSAPSLSVFLTADCTYNCMLIPLCTGEAIPHPYGLLTPPSSPGTSAWMAQGIILPLSLHPAACAPKHTVRPVRRLFIQGTR